MNRSSRLSLWTLVSVGVAIRLSACSGSDSSLEIKLAHSAPPQSIIALAADEFARRANAKLAGRATVVVFGAAQLGGDEVVLQKLKLGTVDMSVPSTVMSSVVDAFALFEMPYLVRDRAHLRQIEADVFWPEVAAYAEIEGYKILALWENGFRHVTNNVRPIVVPSDLSGIKLRTPRSPWRVRLFRELGAAPSPLPFAEVFVALQTGVMDGQENPLSNVVNGNLHEVQRYLSLTQHVYSPAYLTVGLEHWQTLPEEVRLTLEAAAKATQAFVDSTADRMDADLLEQLRTAGLEINDADRERFVRASRSVYDEFDRMVPGSRHWIDAALALPNP